MEKKLKKSKLSQIVVKIYRYSKTLGHATSALNKRIFIKHWSIEKFKMPLFEELFTQPQKLFLLTYFGLGIFSDFFYMLHNLMCLVTSKLLRYESHRKWTKLEKHVARLSHLFCRSVLTCKNVIRYGLENPLLPFLFL